jgi:hypothetical protein
LLIDSNEFFSCFGELFLDLLGVNEQVFKVTPSLLNFTE